VYARAYAQARWQGQGQGQGKGQGQGQGHLSLPAPARILNPRPMDTWAAMSHHQSQWQGWGYWYRKVHVILSSYTYVNVFLPIDIEA